MITEHSSISKVEVGVDACRLEDVVGLRPRQRPGITSGNEVEGVDGVRRWARRVRCGGGFAGVGVAAVRGLSLP